MTINTDTWASWNVGATGGGLVYPQTAAVGYATAAANYATNTLVWNSWIQVAEAGIIGGLAQPPPLGTIEGERAYHLDSAKRELNRQRAVRRARRLLEEILSPEQREQLRMHGFFLVHHGNLTYRIDRGRTHNVHLLIDGEHAIENLCVIPEDFDRVPEEDCMIAQKLLLEADHDAFRRTANITTHGPVVRPSPAPRLTARDWLRLHRPARARRRAA